jgi:predicted amidophosphoribosyltransferase
MTLMANEFAEWVVDFMKEYKIGIDTDIVLSIPMHPIKLFEREINPSHILAKNIAKKLALRYSERLIKKIKNTPPQSKLPRTQRLKNVKFSFCLDKNKESEVRNKRILLVDDLFTTGSTVNECARLLKELDVGYIEVITLARGDAFL